MGLGALFFLILAQGAEVPAPPPCNYGALVPALSSRPDSALWPKDAPNPTFGPELTFDRGSRSEAETFQRLHEGFLAGAEAGGYTVGKRGDLLLEERGDFMSTHAFVVSFPGENPHSPIRVVFKPDGKTKPVVEVVMSPRSYTEYSQKAKGAVEAVFGKMKELGHAPRKDEGGGGHVHMGLDSAFQGNSRLLRNFIVDTLWNHPELHAPFLRSRKTSEAKTLADMGPKYQNEFKKIIGEFDAMLAKDQLVTSWWLRQAIQTRIVRPAVEAGVLSKNNNMAVNLNTEVDTIEFRSSRPQSSEQELFLVYSLLAHRVRYLKEKGGLVPLEVVPSSVTPEQNRKRMETFIQESQLRPEWYSEFFDKGWRPSELPSSSKVDPE